MHTRGYKFVFCLRTNCLRCMERGYIHLYTGNGKGKTTAAFGLAVRAACAGKRVYIGQFVKSMAYNETKVSRLFDGSQAEFGHIIIEQLGRGCYIERLPKIRDIQAAQQALARCAEILSHGRYDVVVLLCRRSPQAPAATELKKNRPSIEDRSSFRAGN